MEKENEGYFSGYSKPYLRPYEGEENEAVKALYTVLPTEKRRKIYERPVEVTLCVDESQWEEDDLDSYRIWHVRRFFKSLEGFFNRYNELNTMYEQLTEDLNVVNKTVNVEECEGRDWRGRLRTFLRYTMTDEALWRDCRMKWKLPRMADFRCLEEHIVVQLSIEARVEKAKKEASGSPKLQKLCITDLPPEVLSNIFSLANLRQARLLASTCMLMKEVGGPYFYHTRSVKLHFPRYGQLREMFGEKEIEQDDLRQIAKQESMKLIRSVGFLISRPDLTDAIQDLSISDGWNLDAFDIPGFSHIMHDATIYGPINGSFNTLLATCHNLTSLCIHYCAITSSWLRTISLLTTLRTVVLHGARIQDESVEHDILHDRIPRSSQVLNLRWKDSRYNEEEITLREAQGRGVWFMLLLFPNLLTFNHVIDEVACLPVHNVMEKGFHCFQGLRRLNLNIFQDQFPMLIAWFMTIQVRTLNPCTLTHLKLRTDLPISEGQINILLESISTALLEVLVLEGIEQGSLTLIDRIAETFPDLIGLTLVRRENGRQRKTQLATWPHQSWEYAARFTGFRRLKYFGWNFYVPVWDCTPAVLLLHEAAVVSESDAADLVQEHLQSGESDYFQDTSSLALPFAAHCATLEIMGLEERICRYFAISHGLNGKVEVNGGYHLRGELEVDSREWNPQAFFGQGWKPIEPTAESNYT
ncbi:hypothetical protein AAF712_013649 [Marasmius tenuissimus]|uniref:F-box domain-containing protein n=1 Tax=Marasmius tenuissimus TaxID=585030 RepID=A0ABR2ZFQ1_9AGAR